MDIINFQYTNSRLEHNGRSEKLHPVLANIRLELLSAGAWMIVEEN